MKKYVYASLLLFASLIPFISVQAQNGPPWVKTNVGYNYILRGIDFPGNQDQVGFISGESLTYNGNGIVLKTTDGGTTWTPKWTGTNMGLEGSCFVDENTGFVAGWPNTGSGWSGFGRTTDGGDTWTSFTVVANVYYFTDVVFKDAGNGIVIGSTGTSPGVWVTTNGGTTWTPGTGVSNGVPYHACYVTGNTYFLVDNGGRIKKSVDNGMTWTTVFTSPGGLLLGIDFFDPMHGMACGDNGVIIISNDGGVTWTPQQVGTDLWHDFGWANQNHVFCCGTPEIVAESTNGGATWGNGFPGSAYNAALYECIFTSSGKGFICGSQGTLLTREPECTAAFTASATQICAGQSVTFTDQSTGGVATWDWYFEGGTPQTSNQPNPVVTYASQGIFDVRLVVDNGFTVDTMLKTNYITVSQPVTPVIFYDQGLLSSTVAAGNQWYRDGLPVSGANAQTLQPALSGWYWDVVTAGGCSSDTSNHIYVMIDGINEPSGNCAFVYSASSGEIKTASGWACGSVKKIALYTIQGLAVPVRLSDQPVEAAGEVAGTGSLAPGLYLIVAETRSGIIVNKMLVQP